MSNEHVGSAPDCEGKVRHASPQMAWFVLLRQRRNRSKDEYLCVYRCSNCGGWHIGSDVLGKYRRRLVG